MAQKKSKKQDNSENTEIRELGAQVAFLRKVIFLLVLVCVVISACLNIYVFHHNTVLKKQIAEDQRRMEGYDQIRRFLPRFFGDLTIIGRNNQDIQMLLQKYHEDLINLENQID